MRNWWIIHNSEIGARTIVSNIKPTSGPTGIVLRSNAYRPNDSATASGIQGSVPTWIARISSPMPAMMIDTICANVADTHWARMQEHEALLCDPQRHILYLGDAAHGMVPTLGQGATQAIEDAAITGGLITREWQAGRRDPRQWLQLIEQLRSERIRFAMTFSFSMGLVLLVLPTYVASTVFGTDGFSAAWYAVTVYITVLGLGFMARFQQGRWKSMRVIEHTAPEIVHLADRETSEAVGAVAG